MHDVIKNCFKKKILAIESQNLKPGDFVHLDGIVKNIDLVPKRGKDAMWVVITFEDNQNPVKIDFGKILNVTR